MKKIKKTFSKTLIQATREQPIPGTLKGTCCMCGEQTLQGNPKKFGANFTCSDYLEPGNVICPYCQHIVKNSNSYRRTMFLLTEHEFKKFKKADLKDIIFNLPTDEEFYLYLTQTWQKLGYIRMNKARNTGSTSFVTVVMDYDIITYMPETLRMYYKLVKDLRALKIGKEVITNATFEMHHIRRMNETFNKERTRHIIKTVEQYKGNPVWDLAIYISD